MRATPILFTVLSALTVACGPSYSYTAPPALKAYTEAEGLRLISSEGLMLRSREVPNEPRGDLDFWVEALAHHLDSRGYVKAGIERFTTARGLPGRTLVFVVPRGNEDWVLSVTLFVVGERIVLLEAAGPFALFEAEKAALAASYLTFVPGD